MTAVSDLLRSRFFSNIYGVRGPRCKGVLYKSDQYFGIPNTSAISTLAVNLCDIKMFLLTSYEQMTKDRYQQNPAVYFEPLARLAE